MKSYAVYNRHKRKDAYDISYCVRNSPGGHEILAEDCRPLLEVEAGPAGFRMIAAKFDKLEGYGPTCVRRFVGSIHIQGEHSLDQWQQDAFSQVDAWLRALGLRG